MLRLFFKKDNVSLFVEIINKIVVLNKDAFQIEIKNFCSNELKFSVGESYELFIHIEIEDLLRDFYEVELIEVLPLENSCLLKFIHLNDVEIYQMLHYNILIDWEKGNKIDWRDLSSIDEKEAWLLACFKWSGIYLGKLKASEFSLNFEDIESVVDFYCLLGETLFGYRGYIGMDMMGFDDCIQYIYKANNNHSTKLILKNYRKLEFLNFHMEILKRFGFKISLPPLPQE
ncbi:hypothetical protein AQ1689_100075 [Tenacibaculum maritimum]|uniref:hypothetical protein n=1 Tax=Tenacibaculum maritimum TaxID=107401 RepID=UPI0012E504BF|nr:hypothetical protein [Tenacibaculum maritimum]CAA0143702.1 hypothetical protein AQ1689_100075 [Tenacibaculum maritimum]CAA0201809.1 hypothetical protein AQ1688_80075 [Tenacibaculum maritimum]CAA0205213.1 hypothetical protein AQ1685_90075 [Tenacibaculum maritimum]